MRFRWTILSAFVQLTVIWLLAPGTAYGIQSPPESKSLSDHVAGVVPAYNVASYDTHTPLSSRQKGRMAAVTTIDISAFLGAGIKAGVSQAANTPEEWDQGSKGFAKRYAAAFADGASGKMLGIFVFPVLFHEDPRYFRKGQGQTFNRLGYSVTRVFVTRKDNGARAFNWSKSLSTVGSSTLSTLYYPKEENFDSVVIRNAAWSFGSEAATNVLKEFWPDIQRKVFGK
jgi:hypothetical protein